MTRYRDPHLPVRLVDVLPADQVVPVLVEKARRSGARVGQMLTDVGAEINDQSRQAADAERQARRKRLTDAGVLKARR